MLFLDSETIGFTGPPILFQYAIDDGPVTLYDFWKKPVKETLELLEWFTTQDVCAFNLTFDWFHVAKIYNILLEVGNKSECPTFKEIYDIDCRNPARFALKPNSALDLMLVARRGPYQYVMDRKPVYIRSVPNSLAKEVYKEVVDLTTFPGALNAQWKIEELEDKPGFSNVVLRFNPKGNLESISQDALGTGKGYSIFKELTKSNECKWRPYPGEHLGDCGWLEVADQWVNRWTNDQKARDYARIDVELLQGLYKVFGCPASSVDDDLAICAANTRWKGYSVDTDLCQDIIEENEARRTNFPVNINSPKQVLEYIKKTLSPIEAAVITSTNKATMKKLAKQGNATAQQILDTRVALYNINLFKKFNTGKFHASVNVIGSLSGRQSGTDGINPQGIPGDYRHPFTMAYDGEDLEGGDFKSFEVTIMDAVYNDPNLHSFLLSGESLHAAFGEEYYKLTHNDIMLSKDHGLCYKCLGSGEYDGQDCSVCDGSGKSTVYKDAKMSVFAISYGAQAYKVATSTGKTVSEAELGIARFEKRFPGIKTNRENMHDRFCSMKQPEAQGMVFWDEPEEYIESLLGFRRYFTVENQICKALFNLANDVPQHWKQAKGKVSRRVGRTQTAFGACQSAIFGAAFQIQAQNLRAAGNHQIQSTGAYITKHIQNRVWQEQPNGIHPFRVRPLNIHDELQNATTQDNTAIVQEEVDKYKIIVPLLGIGWKHGCANWKESH